MEDKDALATKSVTVLYHYTTLKAVTDIVASNELLPSLQRARPNDVRYGEGQYFTDVRPGTMTGAQLSRLLLGHPFEGARFTHYLAVDVTGLTVRRGRSGIFVVPNGGSLDVTGRITGTGRNADDLHEGSVETQVRE